MMDHMFEKKRAQFNLHFDHGQYEDAVDLYSKCIELSESVNSPVNLERERMLAYLAEGRLADNRDEYEESYGYYVNAETLVKAQKNKERIQSRMALCRAKQQVIQSNVAKADYIVKNEMHGHYPVLRGTLAVLQGGRLHGPDVQDKEIVIDDQ